MAAAMSQGKQPRSIWEHNLRLKEFHMEVIMYRDKDLSLSTTTKPLLLRTTVHHHKFAPLDPQ